MEQSYKDKLTCYIEESTLPIEQKEMWNLFMLKSSPEENEAVYEAVSESLENLLLLTKHLRDKILSMELLSEEEWSGLTKVVANDDDNS